MLIFLLVLCAIAALLMLGFAIEMFSYGEFFGILPAALGAGLVFLFIAAFTDPVTVCDPAENDNLKAGTHQVEVTCEDYDSAWDARDVL